MTRRSFAGALGSAALLRAQPRGFVFGFSLYGMKTLGWRAGLAHYRLSALQVCSSSPKRAGDVADDTGK